MHTYSKKTPERKTNLLLVDDDTQLRHLLCAILSNMGYSVRLATDGLSALAEMDLNVPDILISDLYMPGMSGFELLMLVEKTFPHVHVIAMSSAYSGKTVPYGVAAHAFYEKATDISNLIGLLEDTTSLAKQA